MKGETIHFELGGNSDALEQGLAVIQEQDILKRIWKHDHTVWKSEPDEITNRLGWLHVPGEMKEVVPELKRFTDEIRESGFQYVVLLGMGGSSLAPDVFQTTFGSADRYPELFVLDSTDPGAIQNLIEKIDLAKTLFIVSTKSGSTVETLSLNKFMYTKIADAVGVDQAGMHFVAVTDPGSNLEKLAKKARFRRIFLNNPDIGGRYSALSYFGMVPAALIGMDIDTLLDRALSVARASSEDVTVKENPAAKLGVALGELAKAGRDKLTFVISQEMESFGGWIEQLMAESTGKEGKGILPVVGEKLAAPKTYGDDRVFVWLHLKDDNSFARAFESLVEAGHPVIEIILGDAYDIGGQFFLWEMATAIAGQRLDINPFDQPNVESAKVKAREMMAAYQEQGQLPAEEPLIEVDGIKVYAIAPDINFPIEVEGGPSLKEIFNGFLGAADPGAYFTVQAYLPDTEETYQALSALRHGMRDRTGFATTFGYGPRFLHSTGQMHKGDGSNGLFIQITSEKPADLAIPDKAGDDKSSISFGVLIQAQALGDRRALQEEGRKVIRFHLDGDVQGGLQKLSEALSE
ncbi:MAG: glucose-6-phosphate isomerase [Chloroflexota bacterium]|nr:glucose-6-phosphate isomerase [Chloroflexota bacterium]